MWLGVLRRVLWLPACSVVWRQIEPRFPFLLSNRACLPPAAVVLFHTLLYCTHQGRADQLCQPGADWQPFLIHAAFPPNGVGRPTLTARSNYSWCSTRAAQAVVGKVAADTVALSTNGQLLRVESKAGPRLMMMSPQTRPNAGLHPEFFPWNEGKKRPCCWLVARRRQACLLLGVFRGGLCSVCPAVQSNPLNVPCCPVLLCTANYPMLFLQRP